ncbi:DUF2977 domain-containing protein [Mammaliicoccus lentus]|uniref:DUF2977 domain-containing protein n=1 Tax=Mammaliicoccus lentus TaxID=42858 RepID=A0ABS6GT74_MAMLE|nr:DUF2977 domain-containing protein [Mammaliicoccus lentus]MBU6112557.1 DUF2977 domain-containing protein [Mammaliicoccus lentus]
MKILINGNDEIVGYVTDGDLSGSIEAEIPPYLLEIYEPGKLIYKDGQVSINPNFNNGSEIPIQPPDVTLPGSDDELRKMFANMQIQIVQGNVMVSELSQQNARLAQEVVETKQELDKLKGDN